MRRFPLLLLAIAYVSLAACKPAAPETAAAAADTEAAPTAPAPGPETPPPTPIAEEASAGVATDTQAGFAGYGDMKLGSTVEQAKAAWGGELNGKAPADGSTCYYLTPKWVKKTSDFAFMIEDGKFVRYEVSTDKEVAPGGGKVGMSTEELQKLYHGALQSTPHKYVEGGHYLSVDASGVAPSKLVFETEPDGKVSEWRVGLNPQVDYVEGCS